LNYRLFSVIKETLAQQKNVLLTGLSGTAKSFFIADLFKNWSGKVLCLVPSEEKAYDLARDLSSLINKDQILMFQDRDLVLVKENYSLIEVNRILTLQECISYPRKNSFIIATPGSLMYHILSPHEMQHNTVEFSIKEEIKLNKKLSLLVNNGYNRVSTVTRPGEFALRGGILDIYAINLTYPLRIELFGDFIDTMRWFDVDTQRSMQKIDRVRISPADELNGKNLSATLFDYLNIDVPVIFDEPREFYQAFERELKRRRKGLKEAHQEGKEIKELNLVERELLAAHIDERTVIYHTFFPGNIPQVKVALLEHISQKEMEPFYNNHELLFSRLKEWLQKDYTVKLAIKSKTACESLKKELADEHIGGVEFLENYIERGFSSQTLRCAIITDKDIWGKNLKRAGSRRKKSEERLLVEDLKIGDYVVHESYGIGIFRGVKQVENDGVTREYILLEYAGNDKLYLPVDKLDLLYKYTTSGEKAPRLNKLGGSAWERTKKKVAQSIQEMAGELLRIYAARQARQGYSFGVDTPWQRQLENDFPYQETPDQLKAIKEVKQDMESPRPMDRLICGDVGFGKTEVIIRAAFKAVMDGKQVAILVPTTILAEQHYQSFSERFKEYPTSIEALSRFRTAAEQKKIIADIKKGVLDIVIGTHRMLSQDIKFKDLGLLIIDEEHRFGVAQKEKIKALKEMVDVISLSATPIPRSLHMSLTGIRDLSVIETPPPERYPVTTYVMEYNEEIIIEAVMREIKRQGQVFFVHNRIEDIYKVKENLERVLPGVSIALGHGRMREDELAQIMVEFQKGKYQVFLCTTIIESGLDMPNVNTIIIDEADKMGLAQLYQLRGRVGRSNRIAYAYLTYRPDKVISEDAQKRLNAIREFNELGSGMKIALRDLEIRGAGNILGPEQHGYIQAVGFDMYCRLLEQETAKFRGETLREEKNPQFEIDIDYYIPDSYIPDSGTKMRIYRRLLLAVDQQEVEETRSELVDRFGEPPVPVENFLQLATLRIIAKDKEIKTLRRRGKEIELQLYKELPIDFATRVKGHNFKKINSNTVLISNSSRNSLNEIKSLLEII